MSHPKWHPCQRCNSNRVRFTPKSSDTKKVVMIGAVITGVGLGIYWTEPEAELAGLAYTPSLADYLFAIVVCLVPSVIAGAVVTALLPVIERGHRGLCLDCRYTWNVPQRAPAQQTTNTPPTPGRG